MIFLKVQFNAGFLNQILDTARGFINPDVCFTRPQLQSVRNLLAARSADMRLNDDLIAPTTDLAVLINSFGLQCTNCLNKDCPIRDPNAPLPKAQH